jgi:hypothetical protein
LFSTEFGLTLEGLGVKYEEQMSARVIEAEKRANEAEKRANEAEKQANEAWISANEAATKNNEMELNLNKLNQNCHHWYITAQGLEQQVNGVYASRSWRITKPLRFLKPALKHAVKMPFQLILTPIKQAVKEALKPPLAKLLFVAQSHPKVKSKAVAWVKKWPRLDTRLRQFSAHRLTHRPQTAFLESQISLTENANALRFLHPSSNTGFDNHAISGIDQQFKNFIAEAKRVFWGGGIHRCHGSMPAKIFMMLMLITVYRVSFISSLT